MVDVDRLADSGVSLTALSIMPPETSKLRERRSTSQLRLRLPDSLRIKLVSDSVGLMDWVVFGLLAIPCLTLVSIRRLTDFWRRICDAGNGAVDSETLEDMPV